MSTDMYTVQHQVKGDDIRLLHENLLDVFLWHGQDDLVVELIHRLNSITIGAVRARYAAYAIKSMSVTVMVDVQKRWPLIHMM